MDAADGSAPQYVEKLAMKYWGEILRSAPAPAICLALLFFGSGMIDKAGMVPAEMQVWLTYTGAIMMVVGGIGLILILPVMIYRLFKEQAAST